MSINGKVNFLLKFPNKFSYTKKGQVGMLLGYIISDTLNKSQQFIFELFSFAGWETWTWINLFSFHWFHCEGHYCHNNVLMSNKVHIVWWIMICNDIIMANNNVFGWIWLFELISRYAVLVLSPTMLPATQL